MIQRLWLLGLVLPILSGAAAPAPFPTDPLQQKERTCFQTSQGWSGPCNLRSDVAIVYGVDPAVTQRIDSWRQRGYRIHVMTGVSWGAYQDYLYGRFDGLNHEDEAQTERDGQKISHGGDIYYMSPGTNYGKFLCLGVQRALDAGAEAIHLEEPEFWVRAGYSEGFKREWRSFYSEEWQPPHSSVDAQWRASKLKYFLYRRALQQVFDYIQAYNQRSGRQVRCYVPTHSLLSYAHWRIVSPESSLGRLQGCDGYIAQVWTGTARTPNVYRGKFRERTFESAFLEYGAMQNLVSATGRRVWYLNDPVEDNPDHDWGDYQRNWESTLVASLFQPQVSHFEVAPWPERIFAGHYPGQAGSSQRVAIPPAYATELQSVMNALNDLNQPRVQWESGTRGLGVLVSDSLMFQRGEPQGSDGNLSHFYGLALPLLKRGMPVAPVQLENLVVPHALDGQHVLLLSYHGMKPLSPEVHRPLAEWVRHGGAFIVVDDDTDPYNKVREWWNLQSPAYSTPRQHLFEQLGLQKHDWSSPEQPAKVGRGRVFWLRANPASLATSSSGDQQLAGLVKTAAGTAGLKWRETNYLLLRRGPYVLGAGLDESVPGEAKVLRGRFVNLFDAELRVRPAVALTPGSRWFLLDLDEISSGKPRVLAAACKTLLAQQDKHSASFTVEGVADTQAIVLMTTPNRAVRSVQLEGKPLTTFEQSRSQRLLWIRFPNQVQPRQLRVDFE